MKAALSYRMLDGLSNRRLGTHDVACPLCGPSRRSPANRKREVLRIWYEPGFARFHCIRCGEGGWARDGGTETIQPAMLERLRQESSARDQTFARRQLEKARWLWSRRERIEGSPAEKYLRDARGYDWPLPATLGFLPALKPEHCPAMIAAFGVAVEIEPGLVEIDDNQVKGVHLTLLEPDGAAKAGTGRDKFTIGGSKGWPIPLSPPTDLLGLAITEGIEDALSVHEATGLGAWAAGGAGRMPALAERVPAYIECVAIYSHDDEAGQRGARTLAYALLSRSIEVFVEGVAQ